MNQDITAKILDWLQNLGNLAAEELPVFVRETAMYGACSNLIIIVILSYVLFCALRLSKKIYLEEPKCDEQINAQGTMLIFSYFAIALLFIFICVKVDTATKAIFAPRLYVIEKVKNL